MYTIMTSVVMYVRCIGTQWWLVSLLFDDLSGHSYLITFLDYYIFFYLSSCSYYGGCWIGLRQGGCYWYLTVRGDLTPRPDNGLINSSPVTAITPIIRVQQGCPSVIYIPGEIAHVQVTCIYSMGLLLQFKMLTEMRFVADGPLFIANVEVYARVSHSEIWLKWAITYCMRLCIFLKVTCWYCQLQCLKLTEKY